MESSQQYFMITKNNNNIEMYDEYEINDGLNTYTTNESNTNFENGFLVITKETISHYIQYGDYIREVSLLYKLDPIQRGYEKTNGYFYAKHILIGNRYNIIDKSTIYMFNLLDDKDSLFEYALSHNNIDLLDFLESKSFVVWEDYFDKQRKKQLSRDVIRWLKKRRCIFE